MKGFNIAPPPASGSGQNLSPVVEQGMVPTDQSDDQSEADHQLALQLLLRGAAGGLGGGNGGGGPGAGSGAGVSADLFGSTISGVLGVRTGSGHSHHHPLAGGMQSGSETSQDGGHRGFGKLAPRFVAFNDALVVFTRAYV